MGQTFYWFWDFYKWSIDRSESMESESWQCVQEVESEDRDNSRNTSSTRRRDSSRGWCGWKNQRIKMIPRIKMTKKLETRPVSLDIGAPSVLEGNMMLRQEQEETGIEAWESAKKNNETRVMGLDPRSKLTHMLTRCVQELIVRLFPLNKELQSELNLFQMI